MPISLLPKKKVKKRPLLSFRFLRENVVISVGVAILLIAGLVFYFGSILYKDALTRQQEEIASKLLAIQSDRDAEAEESVRDFAARILTIDSVLRSHIYTSHIFAYLERVTHPRVQWKDFAYRVQDGTITMNGATENFTTLGEQIVALEQNSNIHNVTISNIQLDKSGRVFFGVSFKVNEALYRPNLK